MLTGNNCLFVRHVDSNYDVIFLEHYRLDVLLLGSLTFTFSLATTNFIENYKMIDGVSESLLNHFHASWGGRGGGRGGSEERSTDLKIVAANIHLQSRLLFLSQNKLLELQFLISALSGSSPGTCTVILKVIQLSKPGEVHSMDLISWLVHELNDDGYPEMSAHSWHLIARTENIAWMLNCCVSLPQEENSSNMQINWVWTKLFNQFFDLINFWHHSTTIPPHPVFYYGTVQGTVSGNY